MSSQLTPPENTYGSSFTGSEPNLSIAKDKPTVEQLLAFRKGKRKQSDIENDLDIKSELSEFRKEMMEFLNNFSKNQEENNKEMMNDITQIKEQVTSIKSTTDKIILEHAEMKREYVEIKKELSEQRDSLSFHFAEQDELKTHVKKIDNEIVKLKGIELDMLQLKQKYEHLQNEHNFVHQRERMMNLELAGIPETDGENVFEYVIALAQHGVQLVREDIVHAHRVQPRVNAPGKPKNIVVQLKTSLMKDSIISGIRRRKEVTTLNIGVAGVSRKIYVNEHLTPANKILLKQSKEAAKSANYQYVWVRNCKIFARKDDTSKKIYIKDTSDLKKLT